MVVPPARLRDHPCPRDRDCHDCPQFVLSTSRGLRKVDPPEVYALYNQTPRIKYLFISLLFLEVLALVVGLVINRSQVSMMRPVDFATRMPRSFTWFG